MTRAIVTLLAALVLSAPALAQTDHPFNGSWTVAFDGKKTPELEGTVVINGAAGTWDVIAQSRKNPCVGRAYPITIQKADGDELVLTVNRAAALPGCKDSTYTFKKVDDKTMKGEVGDGRTTSLTRR